MSSGIEEIIEEIEEYVDGCKPSAFSSFSPVHLYSSLLSHGITKLCFAHFVLICWIDIAQRTMPYPAGGLCYRKLS